ncbi:MAG: hypothetical protein ACK4MF_07205 [Hyphomicrobiaceae bacterium]
MSKKIFALLAAILLLPMAISAAEAAPHRKAHGAKTHSSSHKVIKRAYHGSRRAHSRRAHSHRASSRRHASRGRSYRSSYRSADRATRPGAEVAGYGYSTRYAAGGRPRQWCGWWMRTQRGGGPHLNVAWNWRNYGSPASPQVGAVVVWRHHVGQIVGRAADGRWLVQSGNDGGAVRTRPRSVAGAVIRM